MNPEIKTLWLEALRSGEYKQGKRCLLATDENGNKSFCCLGVVMDIMTKKDPEHFRWKGERIDLEESYIEYSDANGVSFSAFYLPSPARDFLDLAYSNELVLVGKNDAGESFEEIANWIEKSLI